VLEAVDILLRLRDWFNYIFPKTILLEIEMNQLMCSRRTAIGLLACGDVHVVSVGPSHF